MNQTMGDFKKAITETYNNQLTFICYLRKKLINKRILKDVMWVHGLDNKLHCHIGERYPHECDFGYSVAIGIESTEIISIQYDSDELDIRLRMINNIVSVESETTGKYSMGKRIDFNNVIRDAIKKWNAYASCCSKVMEDRKYGLYTSDWVWNKMKNIEGEVK